MKMFRWITCIILMLGLGFSTLPASAAPLPARAAEQTPAASTDNALSDSSPTVVSSLRTGPNPTSAASVDFAITFSEAVTGLDSADFSLTQTGDLSGAAVTAVSGGPTTYTVSVSTGTGSGNLRLDLPAAATVTSAAAGTPLAELPYTSGDSYATGDSSNKSVPCCNLAPTVISIMRASPNPSMASSVNFTVTFSETVLDVDSSDFNLTRTGALTGGVVTNVSGGPTVYTVTATTGKNNGSLRLNVAPGAYIINSAGNRLTGLPFTTGDSYTIYNQGFKVVSILRASPNPSNAASVNFTVTFSEAVSCVDSADFTLTRTGSLSGQAITSVSGGPSVYTVSVSTGTGVGTLRLNVAAGAAIGCNAAGTSLTNLPYTSGESYTICPQTSPTVVSILRASPNPTIAGSLVNFTVTFSEAVTGVDSADFALTKTGPLSGSAITGVSGTGTVYTVSANTGTGSGTLRLDLPSGASITSLSTGLSLTNLPFISGEYYTVEPPCCSSAPTVVSILRASPNPTSAGSLVNFTVTFSEAVTGVDSADFALTKTGTLSGSAITGVSGTGTVYTVSANTGTGSGTLRLDLPSGASITSLSAGRSLTNLPFITGEYYTVGFSTNTIYINSLTLNPGGEITFDLVIALANVNPGVSGADVYVNYNPALVLPSSAPDAPVVDALPDFFGVSNVSISEVLPASKCAGSSWPCIHLALAGPAQTSKAGIAARLHFKSLTAGTACFAITQSGLVDANGYQVPHQAGPKQCTPAQSATGINGLAQRQGLSDSPNPGSGTQSCSIVSATGAETLGTVSTDSNGGFRFTNPTTGTYTFRVVYPGYLASEKTNVSISVDQSALDLGMTTLRGGDVNGDNAINILDIGKIISMFGQAGVVLGSAGSCGSPDEAADINDDGSINVSDLAITAGNWGKVAPTDWLP